MFGRSCGELQDVEIQQGLAASRGAAIWSGCLGSAPGRPMRLRLGREVPITLDLALMALRPAFTRCLIMLRSNSVKAPVTWNAPGVRFAALQHLALSVSGRPPAEIGRSLGVQRTKL
jgi:hypothetical protein